MEEMEEKRDKKHKKDKDLLFAVKDLFSIKVFIIHKVMHKFRGYVSCLFFLS